MAQGFPHNLDVLTVSNKQRSYRPAEGVPANTHDYFAVYSLALIAKEKGRRIVALTARSFDGLRLNDEAKQTSISL